MKSVGYEILRMLLSVFVMVMALCFDSAYRFCVSVGMWCLWYGYLDGNRQGRMRSSLG